MNVLEATKDLVDQKLNVLIGQFLSFDNIIQIRTH